MELRNIDFIIDVCRILPEDTNCLFRTSNIISNTIKDLILDDNDNYKFLMTPSKLNLFIELLTNDNTIDSIYEIRFYYDNSLIFESFDGIEYGTFSHSIIIPDWFKEKYFINDFYTISNNW